MFGRYFSGCGGDGEGAIDIRDFIKNGFARAVRSRVAHKKYTLETSLLYRQRNTRARARAYLIYYYNNF